MNSNQAQAKSISWFENQIKLLYNNTYGRYPSNSFRVVYPTKIELGKLYHFIYTPKYKDELPYWDMFPLIFTIGKYDDGFLGINLHYLPPKVRTLFFNFIKRYKKSSLRGEKRWSRLDIDYERLKRNRYLEFCIKRYLTIQMRTPLVEIADSNWENIINLPTAKFKKTTPGVVWSSVR